MSIRIIKAGFFTSIQDRGRSGYSHLGVPQSGAMDERAYNLANSLLNNSSDSAVLECTIIGPHIKFLQDVPFVITGANSGALLDGKKVINNIPLMGRKGQVLALSVLVQGVRSYIAFAGGISSEIIMGSRSQYKPVTQEDALKSGTELALGISQFGSDKRAHLKLVLPLFSNRQKITASPGPEYHQLNTEQKSKLRDNTFTISHLWNRMAVQLEEPVCNNLKTIVTSPVVPGTVQLTPSGKMIVLMRDCQTTGGYPRVLQLNNKSLQILAQMRFKDQILLAIT